MLAAASSESFVITGLKFEQSKFWKQPRGDHLLKLTGENYSGGEFLMTQETGV